MKKRISMTLAFLLFATSITGCNNSENKDKGSSDISDSVSITDESMSQENSTITNSQMDSDNKVNVNSETESDSAITVNINISDETVDKTGYASVSDVELNKPSALNGSEVFLGWEEQSVIDEISNNSLKDEVITLTPEKADISDIENAIFNDTVYTNSTSEYVEIPVVVGGKARFSILELEISYDTDLFTFDSFTFTDSDTLCNCNGDKIYISFVSTDNITADVNLCNIKLKKNKSDITETHLTYEVKDIAAWNNASTDYVEVSYQIVNDKIVMY